MLTKLSQHSKLEPQIAENVAVKFSEPTELS